MDSLENSFEWCLLGLTEKMVSGNVTQGITDLDFFNEGGV